MYAVFNSHSWLPLSAQIAKRFEFPQVGLWVFRGRIPGYDAAISDSFGDHGMFFWDIPVADLLRLRR